MPRLRTDITSVVAGVFALAAFLVALLASALGGNDLSVILLRALLALIICYPVGMMAGALLSRVIEDALRDHAQSHPVPVESTEQFADAPAQSAESAQEEAIVV